ncbi:MAG: TIGR03905 family TSCPD domain-containing protein [Alloprevotella sp.]|nr:TIGR03905 family TSCPD domain-containing protein [Alloprevotella sp.]
MRKTIDYPTKGTCSTLIHLEVEDGIIREVQFTGGCNGNLKGICSLVKGLPTQQVLERLEGINCRERGTSCPDQLSRAIRALDAQAD